MDNYSLVSPRRFQYCSTYIECQKFIGRLRNQGVCPSRFSGILLSDTSRTVMLKPSTVLKAYYAGTFALGVGLSMLVGAQLHTHEIGIRGAALTTLCWNVAFMMILPLVLDWSQYRYFKAKFMQLEEIAKCNPDLASLLENKCQELALPKLRLAVVEGPVKEVFSYNLWGHNPRLVVPKTVLDPNESAKILPSVEAELGVFVNQDQTIMFLIFASVQVLIQQVVLWML